MKIIILLFILFSPVYGEEFILPKNTNYISKRQDLYTMLSNGDIAKNGTVRYKFEGGISTNTAYYKMGAFWAGVRYRDNLLEIFPSFSGKKGVRFDKKPIAVLTNR